MNTHEQVRGTARLTPKLIVDRNQRYWNLRRAVRQQRLIV